MELRGELREVLEKCTNEDYDVYISTRSTNNEYSFVEITFKRRTKEDDNGRYTLDF